MPSTQALYWFKGGSECLEMFGELVKYKEEMADKVNKSSNVKQRLGRNKESDTLEVVLSQYPIASAGLAVGNVL